MSILLGLSTKDYVALCTDCQHTHMETGLPGKLNLPKIEPFSKKLYIAHGGSAYIPNVCMRKLQDLYKDGSISDDSITNVVAELVNAYEHMIQEEPEIEKKATSKFIVAGKLKKGTLGLSIVENSPSGVTSRFVEGTEKAQVVIFPPTDMDYSECYEIVNKEFSQTTQKSFPERIEAAFRQSVKMVSEKSSYVSEDSLFYSISDNQQNE